MGLSTDREKVIKELSELHGSSETMALISETIALLKEQEPIPCGEKIKAGDVMLDFYECGHCKNAIRKPWKYCPFCGKVVKWE